MTRALRIFGLVVAVAACVYVAGAALLLASCSVDGSGEGDVRPTTTAR